MDFNPREPVNYPPKTSGQDRGSSPSSDSKSSGFPWTSSGHNESFRRSNGRQSRYLKEPQRDREGFKDSNPLHSGSHHSRHSSRSLAALLLLTNERLTTVTSRNATLEVQQEELLARFTSLAKEKTELEAELRDTQESLRLHRVQLDLAQKEINRANEVVKNVDQARVKAEANATRLKQRLRALQGEKMLRRGWEEGWDIGFKEGMEKSQVDSGFFSRFTRKRATSFNLPSSSSVDDEDVSTPTTSTPRTRTTSRPRRGSALIVASHTTPPPIPTSTTPTPVQHPPRPPPSNRAQSSSSVRNRTPAPAFQRAPSRTSRQSARAPTETGSVPGSSPEDIHPISTYEAPPSPSMSHYSIIPPPDNYIPTMTPGRNGFIPMPPPHELSVPVPPRTPGPSEHQAGGFEASNRERGARDRTLSNISRASTRISEYDLLSSPRDSATREDRDGYRETEEVNGNDGVPERRGSVTPGTGSGRAFEEWRNVASPGVENAPANESSPSRRAVSPFRVRSPRVNGGPRERREIVMPTPLRADQLLSSQPNTPTSAPRIDSQDPVSPPEPSRIKTPLSWLRRQFRRSYSSPAPTIEIEPPSQPPTDSASSSSTLNPVLLSPVDATRPIALPNNIVFEATRGVTRLSTSTPIPNSPITIRLPDDELPLGFVPMTPIIPHTPAIPGSPIPQGATGGQPGADTMFSPIPDNYSLPDPFQSPVSRPLTAGSNSKSSEHGRPGSRQKGGSISFSGLRPWGSPDSARLSRPLSIFSDE